MIKYARVPDLLCRYNIFIWYTYRISRLNILTVYWKRRPYIINCLNFATSSRSYPQESSMTNCQNSLTHYFKNRVLVFNVNFRLKLRILFPGSHINGIYRKWLIIYSTIRVNISFWIIYYK